MMDNGRLRFGEVLEEDAFAVTMEFHPPKGTNVGHLLDAAKGLLGKVHGVNVTDNTGAVMRVGSLAVCRLLYEQGHDPILQVTSRDRNRIGLQSDLLGAHILGIRNVLCLTGDHPSIGDHKEAKPVYDLDSVQIMHMISELNDGRDLAGKMLDGGTDFLIGAAVSPGMDSDDVMHQKFNAKVKAGTRFFQTQALYCVETFRAFMDEVRVYRQKVLGGILVLHSKKMAEFLNANIPGVTVPDVVLKELEEAGPGHEEEAGIDIAVRTIKALRSSCDGVHIMTGKDVSAIPKILQQAELQ